MPRTLKTSTLLLVLAGMVFFVGCNRRVAKATPPTATPALAEPSATLSAEPNVIQQGQTTVLSWQTTNSNEVTITGLGTVEASGSRSLTPGASTTYVLVAKGSGGTKDASTRVTVNAMTANTTPSPTDEDLFRKNMQDIFFDLDKSEIRHDEMSSTQKDASFLEQHPSVKVLVEGHCDDRGSEEYNLALGTSRAESVKQSLLRQGISADRIKTISYGKERPFCAQENEECWQQNRVGHFAFAR